MREIKFRAWHKTKKMMMYFGLSELNDSMITKADDGWYLDDCELMQFTGYADKHRKEIYEGDVVEVEDGDHGVVTWGYFDDCCVEGETWLLFPGHYQPTLYHHNTDNRAQVIGNIYENPELAQKGNKT